MNVLEQMVLAFHSLMYTLRQLFRPSLWVPWLPVLAIQLGVVAALWWFAHPWISWFAAPLIHAAAGENALRYPNMFRVMPELYGRADVVVTAVAGALAVGSSCALFAAHANGQPLRAVESLAQGLRRLGALILANLPALVLALAFAYGLDAWLAGRGGLLIVKRIAPFLALGVAVFLQAYFLWVNPLIMLERRSLMASLATLPRAASAGLWAALTLTGLVALPLVPLQMLFKNAEIIVSRGMPEMIGWLVVIQVLLVTATAFVLTGSSVIAYQGLVGPTLEEEGS
jgi:hypothetical protein